MSARCTARPGPAAAAVVIAGMVSAMKCRAAAGVADAEQHVAGRLQVRIPAHHEPLDVLQLESIR